MRAVGNILVWTVLAVGLPSILYAMTVAQPNEATVASCHRSATCSVCRHYQGTNFAPRQIDDENMILVSPGHPYNLDVTEGDDTHRP